MYFKVLITKAWAERSVVPLKNEASWRPNYDVNSTPEQRRGEATGLPDRFEEAA